MNTETIDLSNLSAEELRQALAKKEKQEEKALKKEREQYENSRDEMVEYMVALAYKYHIELASFKEDLHEQMDAQAKKLEEYGKMRSNSKGGFGLTTKNGDFRVVRTRSTEPVWDERATKAVELIKDFLHDTVKKRDQKLFNILLGFIQKNEKGDLEYGKVMSLFKHEKEFDDQRWKEGLRLIKESYTVHLRGFGYEFYHRNPETEKWDQIKINFTSL